MKLTSILLYALFGLSSLSYSQIKQFRNNLYIIDPEGNPVLMDGTLSLYDDEYSDEVDYQDARKMFNPGENIGMLRDSKVLIVERRKDILDRTDTIFFKFWNARIITYRLELSSKSFENSEVTAVLHDKYLDKKVFISLHESAYYDFAVTADVNSKRPDRFMVVFNPLPPEGAQGGAMPLNFAGSWANSGIHGVTVSWNTSNESGVNNFRVEKSSDGIHFSETGDAVPARNLIANDYFFTDRTPFSGATYYRIKAIDVDGKISYSKIMKVNAISVDARVNLYPNPASSPNIRIDLKGLEKGRYQIRVFNIAGSIVHTQTESLTTEYETIRLTINHALAKGMYRVEIFGPAAYRSSHNLMIK